MNEENYEYMRLHVRHPKNWGEEGSKTAAQLVVRSEQDNENVEHASAQGWEIKATSVFDTDNGHLEIVHLQRHNSHPLFSQITFSDEYWGTQSKRKKKRMDTLLDKGN